MSPSKNRQWPRWSNFFIDDQAEWSRSIRCIETLRATLISRAAFLSETKEAIFVFYLFAFYLYFISFHSLSKLFELFKALMCRLGESISYFYTCFYIHLYRIRFPLSYNEISNIIPNIVMYNIHCISNISILLKAICFLFTKTVPPIDDWVYFSKWTHRRDNPAGHWSSNRRCVDR